ncbi:hypothetical protein SO802_029557 [Lithocarpus litseifolius]|uniref:ATPase AAA-type core domain-containing protein n=1 Tax=Lithocarpus litseifolius TaxID=425828 RepID=A0AAW2BUH8_9ROSI
MDVLGSYLDDIVDRYERIQKADKVVKIYTCKEKNRDRVVYHEQDRDRNVNWSYVNLEHSATFEKLAMNPEQKEMLKDDLDRFLGGKDLYKKVGKSWKRGYLLYGPPGTGKSSLIAAMANYLKFNIYDLNLTAALSNEDLRSILLSTTDRSILIVKMLSKLFRSNSTSSLASRSTSLPEIPQQSGIINSEEYEVQDLDLKLGDWNLPKVPTKQFYKSSSWNLNSFKTDFHVRTIEQVYGINKEYETCYLFSPDQIKAHINKGFHFIHIGLVQVGVKPLIRSGLNNSVLLALRDTRHVRFDDSLLGTVQASLSNGPVHFDCFPNFTVHIHDKNVLQALTLNIKTHGTLVTQGTSQIALIYRVYYKCIKTNMNVGALDRKKVGETLLIQTNIHDAKIKVPRTLRWDEISFPDDWKLHNENHPLLIQEVDQDPELDFVQQLADGSVRLSFDKSRFRTPLDDYRPRSPIDLSRIPSRQPPILLRDKPASQASSSRPLAPFPRSRRDLSADFQGVKNRSQVSTPCYTAKNDSVIDQGDNNSQKVGSPSGTDMENPDIQYPYQDYELKTLRKEFKPDMKFLGEEFDLGKNKAKREAYKANHTREQKVKVLNAWIEFMKEVQEHIFFFEYFENYYKRHKKACVLTKTDWIKEDTKEVVKSSHPPVAAITFKYRNQDVTATPFRFPSGEEKIVRKVIEQNNYTNQCLGVIGKQLDRVEEKIENKVILQPGSPSKPIIEKPLVKLPTARQTSIKPKDVTALELVNQKLEELHKLVKKEPSTSSPSKGEETVITLQETPIPIHLSENPVNDVLKFNLEENLAKDSYGINSNFPYPTKTILDLLQSAFLLDNNDLFQRTLKTMKNHIENLEARNDHLTSLLFGKEKVRSKDKTVLMGTCFARLSLKTQASVRSAFANLPGELQVRILGSKAMSESLDLWFRHFRVLVTTRYYDPNDPDIDHTTLLNYEVENAMSTSRWEAYFGNSLRIYEREKHPFPGLLINYSDFLEDEYEDNQMNPHWLSQMFEYGFVRFIKLTNHNQVSQLPAIIKDTVNKISGSYTTIRCWSTLPEWELNHWATVQPSKHLVLIGGYSYQGPWFEGNTFLSYKEPKALADCWRSFFSHEIRRVARELWKNYHFVGSTGRISIFTNRPYYESIPQIPWYAECNPRQFLTPGKNSEYEPLIYCGLCERFTTYHEHACNNDPPWVPQDDDLSWYDDYIGNW